MKFNRCAWVTDDPLYIEYHDTEWGKANQLDNDEYLFELLTLESAQAGLSWLTILKKREGYHDCFLNFDIGKVSQMNHTDIARLLKDDSIIRHKQKIESVINNAKVFMKNQAKYGNFRSYIEEVLDVDLPIKNLWSSISEIPSQTTESVTLSKRMKKDGFKFIGPTTCYSFLQAAGFVNDHTKDCFLY
ncbi:MAG TPA: DNA-3-methyladenine glycosylase I [Pseudogracilibacillus sp.]|nr:DNA-3-methyladenine glycosylase I [Pseudogracilibacillus sp.]